VEVEEERWGGASGRQYEEVANKKGKRDRTRHDNSSSPQKSNRKTIRKATSGRYSTWQPCRGGKFSFISVFTRGEGEVRNASLAFGDVTGLDNTRVCDLPR
jgi:hypothetical protein